MVAAGAGFWGCFEFSQGLFGHVKRVSQECT